MEFSSQEYWSGQPFPSLGDLFDPGIKPRSPALQTDSLLSETQGKPKRDVDDCTWPKSLPKHVYSLLSNMIVPLLLSRSESGFGLMISFGQWDIRKHNTSKGSLFLLYKSCNYHHVYKPKLTCKMRKM